MNADPRSKGAPRRRGGTEFARREPYQGKAKPTPKTKVREKDGEQREIVETVWLTNPSPKLRDSSPCLRASVVEVGFCLLHSFISEESVNEGSAHPRVWRAGGAQV